VEQCCIADDANREKFFSSLSNLNLLNALIGNAASESLGDDIEVLGAVRECATTINSFLDRTDRKESILSEILKSGAFNHLKTMAGQITLLQG
jgi:hypothetical protein